MLKRHVWVLAHRWSGLTIALFLLVAGVTGAVLPFEEELTLLSRADLAHVRPPAPGARPLSGPAIARAVERQTGAAVNYVPLDIAPGHVARLFVAARPGRAPLGYDMVWADPYSGRVRLAYRWGGVRDGRVDIVPWLFSLHYGIVAGPWGGFAFGVAALIWTLDCFVGFALTLPRLGRGGAGRPAHARPWWRRWGTAWTLRRPARGYRLTYDLHRAGGLWLWPLLLAFAWSSVGLLLPTVERPVMRALGATPAWAPPARPAPLADPPLGPDAAAARAAAALVRLGRARGFALIRPEGLFYDPASATYRVSARTTLDHGARFGATVLWLDARNGRPVHLERPFGATRADGARRLFLLLHFAGVGGLPYRLFVSALGLAVAGLSATGVLIWTRKRSAALATARRRRPAAPAALRPARPSVA